MKFFKYQYSGNMGKVWELFSSLSNLYEEEVLTKRKGYDYEHTLEIIHSSMNGSIPNYNKDFDLRAYEATCRYTDKTKRNEDKKKYLSIVDTVNGSETTPVAYGDISSNDTRLQAIEKAFDLLEENDEFEKCLEELLNLRGKYITEKSVDPVKMLLSSLQGIPEALQSMVKLTEEDANLKELVVGLLCSKGYNNLTGILERAF